MVKNILYWWVRGIKPIKKAIPELAFKLGRYGGYVLAHNEGADRPKVLVGRDTRVSGEMLEFACFDFRISFKLELSYEIVHLHPGEASLLEKWESN